MRRAHSTVALVHQRCGPSQRKRTAVLESVRSSDAGPRVLHVPSSEAGRVSVIGLLGPDRITLFPLASKQTSTAEACAGRSFRTCSGFTGLWKAVPAAAVSPTAA